MLFQVQEHLEKGVETRENLSFNEWICDTLGQVVLVVAQAEFSSGTLGQVFFTVIQAEFFRLFT